MVTPKPPNLDTGNLSSSPKILSLVSDKRSPKLLSFKKLLDKPLKFGFLPVGWIDPKLFPPNIELSHSTPVSLPTISTLEVMVLVSRLPPLLLSLCQLRIPLSILVTP
jgi:hypothetical protein